MPLAPPPPTRLQENDKSLRGSQKLTGDSLKIVLVTVFNFKLGCFCYECNCMAYTSTPVSRVENLASVLSCWLKIVHVVSIETMNGSKTGKTDVNRLIIKELEKTNDKCGMKTSEDCCIVSKCVCQCNG
jgi:hypothetical protein